MEFLKSTLISHILLLCTLAIFLGFISLSLYFNYSQSPPTNLSSSFQILDHSPHYNVLDAPTSQPTRGFDEKLAPCLSQQLSPPEAAATLVPLAVNEASGGLKEEKCDIFQGRWVYDPKGYPLYHGRQCPFLSEQVTCQKNGRPDSGYEHWRWEARGCEIPRYEPIINFALLLFYASVSFVHSFSKEQIIPKASWMNNLFLLNCSRWNHFGTFHGLFIIICCHREYYFLIPGSLIIGNCFFCWNINIISLTLATILEAWCSGVHIAL